MVSLDVSLSIGCIYNGDRTDVVVEHDGEKISTLGEPPKGPKLNLQAYCRYKRLSLGIEVAPTDVGCHASSYSGDGLSVTAWRGACGTLFATYDIYSSENLRIRGGTKLESYCLSYLLVGKGRYDGESDYSFQLDISSTFGVNPGVFAEVEAAPLLNIGGVNLGLKAEAGIVYDIPGENLEPLLGGGIVAGIGIGKR